MRLQLPKRLDAEALLQVWRRAQRLPGGSALFSKLVARAAPYTATIDARILELERGYARLELRDRRAVRNHLNSIHAIALANLAEETTGLGMLSTLPPEARGIVTSLHMEYLKKARGTLVSECRAPAIDPSTRNSYEVVSEIRDETGDIVARGTAGWLVGPRH